MYHLKEATCRPFGFKSVNIDYLQSQFVPCSSICLHQATSRQMASRVDQALGNRKGHGGFSH